MTTVEELEVKFTADVAELQAAITGIQGSLGDMESKGVKNISGIATALGLIGLEEVGRRSVDAAAGFDDALNKVRNNTGLTTEEMAKLRGEFLKLSESIPFTVEQMAAVATKAGDLGVRGADVLPFTKAMLDFQSATGVAAEEAAGSMHRLLETFKMGNDQAAELGNSIVALSAQFKAPSQAVLEFASRISGTGTAVGLSKEQILAWSATLAGAGIESERGAQAITNLFLKVQAAVSKGAEAVAALAVEQAKLPDLQAAYNAALAGMSPDAIERVRVAHDALREATNAVKQAELDLQDARAAGDKDAVKAAQEKVNALKRVEEAAREANDLATEGNAINKAALKTADDALTKQQSVVDSLGKEAKALSDLAAVAGMTGEQFAAAFKADPNGAITGLLQNLAKMKAAGQDVAPALAALGDGSGLMADSILRAANAAEQLPAAVTAAGDALTSTTAIQEQANRVNQDAAARLQEQKNKLHETQIALGNDFLPAVLAVSTGLGDFVGWLAKTPAAMGFVATAITAIVGALIALKIATIAETIAALELDIALWPLTLVILAVAAAIAAIIFIFTHWNQVVDGARIVWKALGDFLKAWIGTYIDEFRAFVVIFETIWNVLADTAVTAWGKVMDFFGAFWGFLKNGFNVVVDFVHGLWEGLLDIVKGFINFQIAGFNVLIGAANILVDALNSIQFDVPDWVPLIGGKHFGFSIPHVPSIPSLDVGGNVVADGLALIHRGEVVVPAAKVDSGFRDGMLPQGGITINSLTFAPTVNGPMGRDGIARMWNDFESEMRTRRFQGA